MVETVEDVVDFVRSHEKVAAVGRESSLDFLPGLAGDRMSLAKLNRVIQFEPDDQVVVVEAGMTLAGLQSVLKEKRQCLPYLAFASDHHQTVGGAVALGLPHLLEAQHGSWREWVLGMKVVRADGTVAKCGSMAVKNVAGYDVARLFIGSRGWLGAVVEVILKTFPLAGLQKTIEPLEFGSSPLWIQRSRLSDVHCLKGELIDPASATLYTRLATCDALPRYEGDWVMRRGCGDKNWLGADPATTRYMSRAKAVFDPEGKFNAGVFGGIA